ncbi:MAG: diguanylate cyclase [Planctomycetes bacterium]|nr:diguanylate cyclase [Planctomycetota bacterium]
MDFSYIQDDRWLDLDSDDQDQMISLGFEQEVMSDPRFQELDPADQNAMLQEYSSQAQEASSQVRQTAIEAEPAPGVFKTIGTGLAHGAHGLIESVGTGLEYVGQRTGSDILTEAGQATKQVYGGFAAEYRPSAAIEGKNVWDNPELLKNAEFWLYNVSDMVPMLAASVIPGVGATKALTLAKAAPKLARLGGALVGGGFGGALEGAQTYNAVLERGGTETEAARSAELMTAGAGVLNALGVGKVLAKAGTGFKAKVIKTMGAAAWEGLTEGLEEPTEVFSKYLGSYLAGEPLPTDLEAQLIESAKAALTVAPIAAVTGGGASIVSGSLYQPPETIQNAPTTEDAVAAAEEEIDSILKEPSRVEVAPIEVSEPVMPEPVVEPIVEPIIEPPIEPAAPMETQLVEPPIEAPIEPVEPVEPVSEPVIQEPLEAPMVEPTVPTEPIEPTTLIEPRTSRWLRGQKAEFGGDTLRPDKGTGAVYGTKKKWVAEEYGDILIKFDAKTTKVKQVNDRLSLVKELFNIKDENIISLDEVLTYLNKVPNVIYDPHVEIDNLIIPKLKKQGYDAIEFIEGTFEVPEIIVFNPKNVKQIKKLTREPAVTVESIESEVPVAPVEPVAPVAPLEPTLPTPGDRRQDIEMRKRIEDMTLEEAQLALKTDDLTGLGNRRAYDEAIKKPVQSSIDVDSLKSINDEFGHEAGDELLQLVGEALQQTNLESFHISGDEYITHGETEQEVADNIEIARTYLEENPMVLVDNNGNVVAEVKGTFSYGTGETYKEADIALAEDKAAREVAGERAARGEEPKGIKRYVPGEQISPQEEIPPGEREAIGNLISSRQEKLQGLEIPNEADQAMMVKLDDWQKSIEGGTATDKELRTWEAETRQDVLRAQKEQSLTPKPAQMQLQAGWYAPGESVKLEEITEQFKDQEVFKNSDNEISVRFKNGQGITVTKVKDLGKDVKEIAFDSGQMDDGGIIYGMTEHNKITLDGDHATLETAYHELEHALRNLGILTKKDDQTLMLELNRLEQANKFRYSRSVVNHPSLSIAQNRELERQEDLANVWAQVITDRKKYRGTKIGAIIQKVMDFLDQLRSMLTGKQTMTALAKEFESEKMFSRVPKDEGSVIPMFQTDSDRQSQPFDVPEGSTRRDTAKYWIIDVLDPVKKTQAAIGEDKITEREDYLLQERLRRNKQGKQIDKAKETLAQPIVDLMAENNFNTDQVDEALYGRHAIEANKRLRLTNARRFLLDLADTNEKDYLKKEIDKIDTVMKELDLPNAARQTAYLELLRKELQYTTSKDTKAIKREWQMKSPMFSGITDAEATKINAKWADDADMQTIMKLTDKITDATIDVSLKSGRITPEEADAFKTTFKHYVPLFREGHTTQSGLFGTGQGIVNLGQDYKIRGGSSARAVNMLGNVLIQHEQAIRRAGKAEAGRTFLELVKANPNKNFWRISEKTLINAYDEHGNIYKKDDYKIEANDIPLKIDGKYYIISMNADNVHAMRIAEHLKGSDVQTGWMVKGLSRFNRLLANVYTGLNPEFILTNPVRDIQIAAVNLSSTEAKDMTVQVLKDVPKAFMGVRDVIRGDATTEWGKIAQEAQEAGMMMSWSEQGQDVEKLAKNINREVKLQQKNVTANVARTTMKIGKLIKDYNMIAENMTRLAAYKNARDAGLSKAKAALLGKELTVNFEQKGLYGEIYNSLYLFSSAGVQGSTRLISGLVKSSKARKMVGGLMLSAMGVAITNGLMGGDDEDGKNNYANVNDYDKERNMIFIVPNSDGKIIKIPLGWGLNFFWNIGTEFGDAALAAMEPKTFKYDIMDGAGRLLNAGLNAFNPIQSATIGQAISPTITDPFMQIAENKTFSGAPLMPEKNKFEDVPTPDSQRYWKTVRPTSKAMAEWVNNITGGDKVEKGVIDVSPETLDMILDTYTGGLGKFVEGVAGLPKTLSADEVDVKKIPIARRFVGTTSKTKGRQEFYANAQDVKMLLKKIKTYPEKRRELMKDPRFRLKERLASTERQIKALRKILKKARSEKSKARLNERIKKLQYKFNEQYEKRINK